MGLISSLSTTLRDFFYKKNQLYSKGSSYLVGQKGAVWLTVDEPYKLYNCIPQLKNIISKKAMMFSNMSLKLVNKSTGEVIDDKEFYNFINNPNVMQSMNDWLRQYKEQEQVYGNQFIYKNKPSSLSKYPVSLTNISPRFITPYLTGKTFDQVSLDAIISHYEYYDATASTKRRFETSEVLFSRLNDLDNPIIGVSPLESLIYPISNTKAAYEYRNVIMTEKGAIGILSNESKDSMGAIPVDSGDRAKIERSYQKEYGIGSGQSRIHITEASLKWQPMTYPTKELMLFEEIDANQNTLLDAFGINRNLYKDSTFENLKSGLIQTYQDTIIPEADQFTQALTKFIITDKNFEIVADYSHLQILQSDKSKEADTISKQIAAINQLVSLRMISNQEAIEAINKLTGMSFIPQSNVTPT